MHSIVARHLAAHRGPQDYAYVLLDPMAQRATCPDRLVETLQLLEDPFAADASWRKRAVCGRLISTRSANVMAEVVLHRLVPQGQTL